MHISNIEIENFRSIESLFLDSKELTVIIGDNGTAKTTILEAVNFCLSPYYLSGKIRPTDFYDGTDEPIKIKVTFNEFFDISLPDGYNEQRVSCNAIELNIKKRDKASPGKAFSDQVVTTHWAVPFSPKDNPKGWILVRKTGSPFKFDERQLSMGSIKAEELPRCFYLNKNRDKQLQRGFNSSITSVFDDYNWRFLRSMRKDTVLKQDLKSRIEDLGGAMIDAVGKDAVKSVFGELNERLSEFGINSLDLAFVDHNAPYDSAVLSKASGAINIPTTKLGSGIEIIASLLFLEIMAACSKGNYVVVIDEPELHLHPALQDKLMDFLVSLSQKQQVFISTHSPYLFKGCLSNESVCLVITEKDDNGTVKTNVDQGGRLLPWSPSWGEVNYLAFGMPTVEFHNELYGYLQDLMEIYNIGDFDTSLGFPKNKK